MSTTTQNPHIDAMSTALVRTIPYRPWTRFRDSWMIGRRDADSQIAHESAASTQPSASLRELEATLIERCERERMTAVRTAATLIDERTTLTRRVSALQEEIARDEQELDKQRAQDANATTQFAKTEAHLDPGQRAARRAREAAARIAPLAAALASAHRARAEAQERLDVIAGRLTTLYDSLQARTYALARHYERRCCTQIRAYLRRSPADVGHPLNTRAPLEPPAWATGPNPWLRDTDGDRGRNEGRR